MEWHVPERPGLNQAFSPDRLMDELHIIKSIRNLHTETSKSCIGCIFCWSCKKKCIYWKAHETQYGVTVGKCSDHMNNIFGAAGLFSAQIRSPGTEWTWPTFPPSSLSNQSIKTFFQSSFISGLVLVWNLLIWSWVTLFFLSTGLSLCVCMCTPLPLYLMVEETLNLIMSS